MKRFYNISLFLLMFVMLVGVNTSFAQKDAPHPAPDVDGKIWMDSTGQEKKAFLFGAGSAIALEYHIRDKHSEEPSRFVKGWIEGLKDMTWSELSNNIDNYYRNNPDKMNRHVFEVVWHEIIAPRWKK